MKTIVLSLANSALYSKMKNLITILLMFIAMSMSAQTNYDKTISVTIVDFSEACGEDPGDAIFCLTDENGGKITERFSCNMDNQVWQVEPKDLITSEWVLNAKYKGKKATLYCVKSAGGAGWVVKKVVFNDASLQATNTKTNDQSKPVVFEKDNFKTATCRAYDMTGKLIAIVDNNVIWAINNGVKYEAKNFPIQNKNEVCVQENKCVKVKVEANDCVSIFKLPNITDKTGTYKIDGDKIYRTKKDACEPDKSKEYYYFKGNKEQIALIAIARRLGMGG